MTARTGQPRGRSPAWRITCWVTAVLALALSLLAAVALLALNLHFEARDRERLHRHVEQARGLLARVDNTAALAGVPQTFVAEFGQRPDLAVRIQGAYAQPLWELRPEAQIPETLMDRPGLSPPAPLVTWRDDAHVWRGIAMRVPLPMPGAAPLTVAMALDIQPHEHFVANLRRVLIAYVLLATAIGALLTHWVARRQLRAAHG